MNVENYFDDKEKALVLTLTKELIKGAGDTLSTSDVNVMHAIIEKGIEEGHFTRDQYGINPTIRHLRTAVMLTSHIAPDRSMIVATMLYELCKNEFVKPSEIESRFGSDIAKLVRGLLKVSELYQKQAAVENDNFHKLLLTFADDIRVVIIMIVDRLNLMQTINHHPNEKFVHDIANESRYLYAPLAHRLGLYIIK